VAVELAVGLPVHVPQLVAGRVLLVLGELHALALVGALVLAGEDALHHRARAQADPGEARERLGIEQRHGSAQAPTSATSRSMSWRLVTPSLSAVKLGSTRWRRTGRASAWTSSMLAAKRPLRIARALAPSTRYWLARGPAPQVTCCWTNPGTPASLGRVARTSATA